MAEQCGLCGYAVAWKEIIYDEGRILCPACMARMYTCGLCEEIKHCAFEEDTKCNLPKVVVQTMRRGNQTIQTQVRNPERIKAICPSCKCWNQKEEFCNRECHTCGNWHEVNVSNR
jgi:hypothetical protein